MLGLTEPSALMGLAHIQAIAKPWESDFLDSLPVFLPSGTLPGHGHQPCCMQSMIFAAQKWQKSIDSGCSFHRALFC